MLDKKMWLENYEGGKPEASIAKDSRCDIRTIRRGIGEARREREAQAARVDILKQAVLRHQDSLLHKLEETLSALALLAYDWAVLPWYQTGAEILAGSDLGMEDLLDDEDEKDLKDAGDHPDMVLDMLRQHLRTDKLWKLLALREKAYASHRSARLGLQCKVVWLLQQETGCKLEARGDAQPPFLYTYTTGELCYRITLGRAFGEHKNDSFHDEIIVDPGGDRVVYRSFVLAEVPGKAEECRGNLLNAFRKAQALAEVTRVIDTSAELEAATLKAKRAIEELRVLGLVPGVCRVCRRLGM